MGKRSKARGVRHRAQGKAARKLGSEDAKKLKAEGSPVKWSLNLTGQAKLKVKNNFSQFKL
jgi:hypothetical protein